MRYTLPLALVLILLICGCKKREGPKCHYELKVTNNSGDTVKFLQTTENTSYDSCTIATVGIFAPGKTATLKQQHNCWEGVIEQTGPYYIYITPPEPLTYTSDAFLCDSFEYKYKVLKTIRVTKENGQQNNFHYIYP